MPEIGRRTIDSVAIYDAVNKKRERYGLSWREATEQITGSENPTMASRLRRGCPVSADMLGSIMMWLDVYDVRKFLLVMQRGRRFTVGMTSEPEQEPARP